MAAFRTPRHPRSLVHPLPVHPYSSGTGHRRGPRCPRGKSCRTERRSDTRLLSSLSRVTPSAVSEHFSELIGCPISCPSLLCCVCPELRPLPSAGVTRLHRYYEPLRHPTAPGPSLAGVRLIFLTTPWGLPCCVRFPCVHAVATTPARRLGASSARFPSRVSLPRYGSPVGPRIGLFEAYSAFTRVTACTLALSPYFAQHLSERLKYFVTSIVAPVASGWSICRAA